MASISEHAVVGAIAALVISFTTGSTPAAISTLASAVVVDLDHTWDYYQIYGLRRVPRMWVFLHSWELAALLWLVYALLYKDTILMSIAVGYTIHLAMDVIRNHVRPVGYLLLYRVAVRFSTERITGAPSNAAKHYADLMRSPFLRIVAPYGLRFLVRIHGEIVRTRGDFTRR